MFPFDDVMIAYALELRLFYMKPSTCHPCDGLLQTPGLVKNWYLSCSHTADTTVLHYAYDVASLIIKCCPAYLVYMRSQIVTE